MKGDGFITQAEQLEVLSGVNAKLLAALTDQTCTGCEIRLDTPSDFHCPFCKEARDAIKEARK